MLLGRPTGARAGRASRPVAREGRGNTVGTRRGGCHGLDACRDPVRRVCVCVCVCVCVQRTNTERGRKKRCKCVASVGALRHLECVLVGRTINFSTPEVGGGCDAGRMAAMSAAQSGTASASLNHSGALALHSSSLVILTNTHTLSHVLFVMGFINAIGLSASRFVCVCCSRTHQLKCQQSDPPRAGGASTTVLSPVEEMDVSILPGSGAPSTGKRRRDADPVCCCGCKCVCPCVCTRARDQARVHTSSANVFRAWQDEGQWETPRDLQLDMSISPH